MKRTENWKETYQRLTKADKEKHLEASELEELGLAAYMIGLDDESYRFFEQAHAVHLERENIKQAARCAFWLGLIHMNLGEMARSSGWMSKGERLLTENGNEGPESGLFLIPAALGALHRGEADKALENFEIAVSIGEEFADADLIVLARLGQGQALIQLGDVIRGVKLLDEAMVNIETDEVYPIVVGIGYCAVIEMCRRVWDLRRAKEWTTALKKWCDSQPEIVPFRGQCLVRRAEILQFHGDWDYALEQTNEACDLLTRPPGEPAAGEAFYRKAELCRILGDFDAAASCYQEAAKLGRNPQPGLSLLRLAQGQLGAAVTSIRNTLRESKDPKRLAELLPGAIAILVAGNHLEEATQAVKKLNNIAKGFDSLYLQAISIHCQGAVFFAKGNFQFSLDQLQKALKIWNWLHLPYESALTSELKGRVYRELNDQDNSEAELLAAQWNFEQLKAAPDYERVSQLLSKKKKQETHGLTLREVQVLKLLASGKSNRFIGDELFISERTVDRHVSNIYQKLRVTTRVEAAAFALKHNLLD